MSPRLQTGVRLFNEQKFFECHEILEEEWTPERGPRRLFLQALIQIAVGLYHWRRGNVEGASGQLRKGLQKLAEYLPECEGVDTARLYRDTQAFLEGIEVEATKDELPCIYTLDAG